jgi:hypothetical protein
VPAAGKAAAGKKVEGLICYADGAKPVLEATPLSMAEQTVQIGGGRRPTEQYFHSSVSIVDSYFENAILNTVAGISSTSRQRQRGSSTTGITRRYEFKYNDCYLYNCYLYIYHHSKFRSENAVQYYETRSACRNQCRVPSYIPNKDLLI